ncbi:MAG TPA: HAD family hydrolase [Phycisphaerae bacterium]|nr:HAD family hydrolase [Phycisphaerae bacterium]
MIEAVAFDLDDTLVMERDYVRSGFAAVAAELDHLFGPRCDWFACLWRGFEAGVRGDTFNRVLAAAGVTVDDELIARLVRCYREHEPQIALCDDVLPALRRLGLPQERLGVITDGPLATQQRKAGAVGLEHVVGCVIFTDRWGMACWKPHPRAFEEFERWTGCSPESCAYVADNPTKDFSSPHARGWTAVRIARPGGLHSAEAATADEVDHTIDTLADLPAVLGLER